MRITTSDFDLSSTLHSGQLFRYAAADDGFAIFHRDQAFFAQQQGDRLLIDGTTRRFAKRFFGLDHDVSQIKKQISKDTHVTTAIATYPGLRILRQDPWECTVSFICSSCASIPKITQNLQNLSRKFGESVEVRGIKGHTFPEPGSMDSLRKIKNAGTGYRSKYLQALNIIGEGPLLYLHTLPYTDAKETLVSLDGIGPKVADCILLFSHGFHNAFPVDTWIKKCMQSLYFNDKPISDKKIRTFADEYFGTYAGYAQQYLFHWIRTRSN